MRRVLALIIIATAAVVAAPAIATAGDDNTELDLQLVSPIEPLTFEALFDDGTCVEGDFDALIEANGNEVTPISVTQSPSDPDLFVIVLPSNTEPGELSADIECDDGDGTTAAQSDLLWASIPVTKVVTGPAPADATFVVHLDCNASNLDTELPEDFTVDLAFGVAGGLKYVYTDHPNICTVTEPVNGGATTVQIVPPVVDTTPAPAAYPVTVTNTFAVALQPSFTG